MGSKNSHSKHKGEKMLDNIVLLAWYALIVTITVVSFGVMAIQAVRANRKD
jgi:hypothetical protein